MKRFIAKTLSVILNLLYRLFSLRPRRDLIAFLSRQSNTRSADFLILGRYCEQLPQWEVIYRSRMLDGGPAAKISYALHMIAEVHLLARCRICFVEGYNPTLSLLKLESIDLGSETPNTTAPTNPLILQLWHAGGMYKKFGFQTLDTPEGRSIEDAMTFHMHRNYSWIICSGEGARSVYAQALGYPIERVVALGRPSYDLLYEPADAARQRVYAAYPHLEKSDKPIIVFAPTLRRSHTDMPFDELRQELESTSWAEDFELVWSYHPVLCPSDTDRVPTLDLLRVADLVVTDYSSIIYDAELLGVPFVFYIPDIESYRLTPGLNTDPLIAAPELCFTGVAALRDFLSEVTDNERSYPHRAQRAFVGDALSACGPGSTKRIVDFALKKVTD